MNEKQIQEVLELVDDYANHPSHEFRSAIERALREQVREVPDVDDLKDRLVAASEAVEDQDDRAAQAIIGETLRLLSAAPQAAQPDHPEQVLDMVAQPEQPNCKTCNGEGGEEVAASSTSYFWRECADCGGSGKTEAAQPEQTAEPVMIYRGRCTIDCGEHGHCDVEMLKMIPAGTRLYTTPQPKQREPMTDEQIDEIIRKLGYASLSPGEVAREVEHFHGITKKEQQ